MDLPTPAMTLRQWHDSLGIQEKEAERIAQEKRTIVNLLERRVAFKKRRLDSTLNEEEFEALLKEYEQLEKEFYAATREMFNPKTFDFREAQTHWEVEVTLGYRTWDDLVTESDLKWNGIKPQ